MEKLVESPTVSLQELIILSDMVDQKKDVSKEIKAYKYYLTQMVKLFMDLERRTYNRQCKLTKGE